MTYERRLRTPRARLSRAALLLGLCGLASVLTTGALLGDATTYRGGSGLSGSYGEKLAGPLALNWKYTANMTPRNTSAPAVSGNSLFFAAGSRVYCLDTESGAMKWRYPQDEPLSTTIASSPAVADGTVYFGAANGSLLALNAETGRLSWQFDSRSSISSSPTVVDSIVYFGTADGHVWALDSRTHDVVGPWKGGVKLSDEVTGGIAVANGFVYALSLDQTLNAIGAATGKLRWQYRVPSSVFNLSPMAIGEYVYVANGSSLHCVLGRNGLPRWTQVLPSEISVSPAANDQTIYVVCNDNRIYSFDARTGRVKWKTQPKLEYDVVAPPTLSGDTLFVGTTLGGLYAVDAESGATKWTYRVEPSSNTSEAIAQFTNVTAPPVIANGSLYVLSDDGSVSSFRADAPDSAPPSISDIEPEMGLVINGTPPFHFEARVLDEGSGINPATVRISVDGEGAPKLPESRDVSERSGYKYDVQYSLLEYDILAPTAASTVRPLSEGKHTVTITAADWKGNVATKTWSFTVDNSIAKRQVKKRDQAAAFGSGGPGGMGSGGPGGMGRGGSGPGGMGRGGSGPGGMGRGGPGGSGSGRGGPGGGSGRGGRGGGGGGGGITGGG